MLLRDRNDIDIEYITMKNGKLMGIATCPYRHRVCPYTVECEEESDALWRSKSMNELMYLERYTDSTPITIDAVSLAVEHNHAPPNLPLDFNHPSILRENTARGASKGSSSFRPPLKIAPADPFLDFLYATSASLPLYVDLLRVVLANSDGLLTAEDLCKLDNETLHEALDCEALNAIPRFVLLELATGVQAFQAKLEEDGEGCAFEDWRAQADTLAGGTVGIMRHLVERTNALRPTKTAKASVANGASGR
jgi:hypothetical protein